MRVFMCSAKKPAALNLSELLALKAVVKSSDRLYGLAHTYLGYPMVWQARKMVRTGVIGAVRKVIVEYPQGWLSRDVAGQGNKQASWRDQPEQSGLGGCIGDIGTHAFSLAEFVADQPIEQVCASLGSHVAGRQLDDDAAMLFKMAAGASGVLIASQVCAGEENPLKIRVYGDKGGLEWRQEEPASLIHRSLDQPLSILRSGVGQPWLCEAASQRMRLPAGHPEGYLEAMANLYGDFATAIRSNVEGNDAPRRAGHRRRVAWHGVHRSSDRQSSRRREVDRTGLQSMNPENPPVNHTSPTPTGLRGPGIFPRAVHVRRSALRHARQHCPLGRSAGLQSHSVADSGHAIHRPGARRQTARITVMN